MTQSKPHGNDYPSGQDALGGSAQVHQGCLYRNDLPTMKGRMGGTVRMVTG